MTFPTNNNCCSRLLAPCDTALGSPWTQDLSLLLGESGFPDWLFLNRGIHQLFLQLKSSEYDGHLTPLLARARDRIRYEASHSQQHADSPLLRERHGRRRRTAPSTTSPSTSYERSSASAYPKTSAVSTLLLSTRLSGRLNWRTPGDAGGGRPSLGISV